MEFPDIAFADIVRLFGRVGFVFLVIGVYRVYQLVASPMLKKESRGFIIMFLLTLVLSIALTVADTLSTLGWLQDVSLTFNVISMYILAIYLNYQATMVTHAIGSEEYIEFTEAMDALITKLKS